tara:strand:+ start:2053 stop:2688 length:636 start_codon:yes stop_codon:yes gene_type:complete
MMEHDFIIKPCTKKSLFDFLKLYTDRHTQYKRGQTPRMTELRLRRFNFDELFAYVKAFAEQNEIIIKWKYENSKQKKIGEELEKILKPELAKEAIHIYRNTWRYFYIKRKTWYDDPNSYIKNPSLEVKKKYLKAIEDLKEEFYKALRIYEKIIIEYQKTNSYSFNETQIQIFFNIIPDFISDKHEKSDCINQLTEYRCFKSFFNKPSVNPI